MDNHAFVINALVMQRNEAMDRHAQAIAQAGMLAARVEELERQKAEQGQSEVQNDPPQPPDGGVSNG